MPISKLKAMPAFHTDAPPQIRHAVALFAIVWLIESDVLSGFRGWVSINLVKCPRKRQR